MPKLKEDPQVRVSKNKPIPSHTLGPIVPLTTDANGITVSMNGKKIGRPKKFQMSGLTKAQMRALYDAAFDANASLMFTKLFELAVTDKDLLKFVIEQRIGKAAQMISGDEQAPLTVIVRRGSTDSMQE